MDFIKLKLREARAERVEVSEDSITVDLSDGRTISAPLVWYPRLLHATLEERVKMEYIGKGSGIHWPELDEDLSVEDLLVGNPSGESQPSLQRWLQERSIRGIGGETSSVSPTKQAGGVRIVQLKRSSTTIVQADE